MSARSSSRFRPTSSGERSAAFIRILALKQEFGAIVGDGESGSIAWVVKRYNLRTLILSGVTDLVGTDGGEAYDGNIHVFEENTLDVLQRLVIQLPDWIGHCDV